MKCPNCRCIVPNNVLRCMYCGYELDCGTAKTYSIEEMYREKFFNDYLPDDLCCSEKFCTSCGYEFDSDRYYENSENDITLIAVLMLLIAVLLLLAAITLLI